MGKCMGFLLQPVRLDAALADPRCKTAPGPATGQVYKLSHAVSGKSYIGISTVSLYKRMYHHCRQKSGCHKIRNAIQRHGAGAFTLQVLDFAVPLSQLPSREIMRIEEHNAMHPTGYNLRPGGTTSPMHSEFVRQKSRATKATPEGWQRSSAASKKTQARPDVVSKKSAAMVATCKLIRDKKSASATEAMNRPDVKKRHKEGCNTPVAKRNRSRATANTWKDPEISARRSAGITKAWVRRRNNPEAAANHKKACQEAGKKRREARVRAATGSLDDSLEQLARGAAGRAKDDNLHAEREGEAGTKNGYGEGLPEPPGRPVEEADSDEEEYAWWDVGVTRTKS